MEISVCFEKWSAVQQSGLTMFSLVSWIQTPSQPDRSVHMPHLVLLLSESLMSAWWLALMACVKATLTVIWLRTMTGKRHSCQPQHPTHMHQKRYVDKVLFDACVLYIAIHKCHIVQVNLHSGPLCVNYLAGSWLFLLPAQCPKPC